MKSEELKYFIDNKMRGNNIYIHTLWGQDKINKYICSFLNTMVEGLFLESMMMD